MEKILLFYKYVAIEDPHSIMRWQRELCERLAIKGRIILAKEGINATVGGTYQSLVSYQKAMLAHPLFDAIDFKDSPGSAEHFPRLSIKIKQEIVKFNIDPTILSARDAGEHLSVQQAHAMIGQKTENLLLLDGRNAYESRIGTFTGAITPDIQNFRDFPEYIQENKDLFDGKDIIMFCTGGIRCERASAYVKTHTQAKNVYQIYGGIHRYTEAYPDGHFRGKNYVFDARIGMKITDDILGTCDFCTTPCDDYTNCINAECNKQILVCLTCLPQVHNTCSPRCSELVQTGQVNIRILPRTLPQSLSHDTDSEQHSPR